MMWWTGRIWMRRSRGEGVVCGSAADEEEVAGAASAGRQAVYWRGGGWWCLGWPRRSGRLGVVACAGPDA